MRKCGSAIGWLAFVIAWLVVGLFACSILFVVGYAVAGGVLGGLVIVGLLILIQYPLMRLATKSLASSDSKPGGRNRVSP
jgi:hypothetical protein